ncbi:MAG: chromate transporter [Acidobacteriota bacterium]|nr:chromate transporter [Acidobacteriota bacterium]
MARLALRLGITAFGGPAVHIAMLRDEVVTRRRWMTDEEFLDLLGATNLIPGPNSTEMVMHAGYVRAGWPGFAAGGALFILPATLIVLAFAWAYVTWGQTPAAEWLLYGIKPVIIAVVLEAIFGLFRTAAKTVPLALLGAAACALYLMGVNELAILFGAGALVFAFRFAGRFSGAAAVAIPVVPDLMRLFMIFAKIGAVLYGSGYVLVAFLRTELVERRGWLTDRQLLDAVAVGQFTPGPLFTTATFIGYVTGSWPGALIATVAIFLPAFIFVAISIPLLPRLRQSLVFAAILDGVNVAALGLMAGVTWQLARSAIIDVFTAVLAALAAAVLLRWRLNSAWLVLAGAAVAFLARWLQLM